ncbi:hypothetical protein P4S72_05020 [Vibrio sp. PP-XX7]
MNNTPANKKALDAELKHMEQMHQDYEAELVKMRQMRQEYESKLNKVGTSDAELGQGNYDSLKAAIDKITLFGFFRAKYDHDDRDGIGSGANNKHFYMDLEAKMKVSDDWEAHFQSETRKGYTVNQSWRDDNDATTTNDAGSSDQDGTLQRVWVEGKPYGVGVALGTKWWGLGFQNVLRTCGRWYSG